MRETGGHPKRVRGRIDRSSVPRWKFLPNRFQRYWRVSLREIYRCAAAGRQPDGAMRWQSILSPARLFAGAEADQHALNLVPFS